VKDNFIPAVVPGCHSANDLGKVHRSGGGKQRNLGQEITVFHLQNPSVCGRRRIGDRQTCSLSNILWVLDSQRVMSICWNIPCALFRLARAFSFWPVSE
jgi:hypothetical protein